MSVLKKSVMKFAGYDVSELGAYVEEREEELIARSIGEARTVQLVNVRDGIKHTERIHTLSDQVDWQSGEGCGFEPGDPTAIGKFDLSVVPLKWEKEWCNEDLVGFWPQIRLRQGAMAQQEELPFEEAITNQLVASNALMVDSSLWKSDTALSTSYLQYFNGFKKIITGSADAIEANDIGVTSITVNNVYEVLMRVFINASEGIESHGFANDIVMMSTFKGFIGRNIYNLLVQRYINENWFHLDPRQESTNKWSIELYGTGMMLEVVPGLHNDNFICAGKAEDLYVGTDGVSDTAEFKMWYNPDTDTIRARSKFRLGVGIPFFDQIVKFTLESGS